MTLRKSHDVLKLHDKRSHLLHHGDCGGESVAWIRGARAKTSLRERCARRSAGEEMRRQWRKRRCGPIDVHDESGSGRQVV